MTRITVTVGIICLTSSQT